MGVWELGPEVGHWSQYKLPLIRHLPTSCTSQTLGKGPIQAARPTPPPGAAIIPVIRRAQRGQRLWHWGLGEQGAQQREQLRINVLRKEQA